LIQLLGILTMVLGPKIYFIRQSKESKKREERFANLGKDFGNKEQNIQNALFDYIKWLEIQPDMEIDKVLYPK
jgi:hypothetical protein